MDEVAVMAVAVLLLLQLVVHTLYMSANGRTGGQTDRRSGNNYKTYNDLFVGL